MTKLLTENFSWAEVELSQEAARLGFENKVPEKLISAVLNTAKQMERVRALLQAPILVTSWYRGPALQSLPQFANSKSQHAKGEAVDFHAPAYGSPVAICKKLIKYPELVRFDQLILEHGWVHISFNSVPGGEQRMQVLSLLNGDKYAAGLTDVKGIPL